MLPQITGHILKKLNLLTTKKPSTKRSIAKPQNKNIPTPLHLCRNYSSPPKLHISSSNIVITANNLSTPESFVLTVPKNLLIRENQSIASAIKYERKKYKILSIDGGGIRGILPARLLTEIEKKTKKPIAESFDLIAGTSTGGILASGLTAPKKICDVNSNISYDITHPHYSANDLLNLYKFHGKKIFIDSFFSPPGLLHICYALGVSALTIMSGAAANPDMASILGLLTSTLRDKTLSITGAITVCSILIGSHYPIYLDLPLETILNFFYAYLAGRYIFNPFIRPLIETKFLNHGLSNMLEKYFQDRKVDQAVKPILLTSYSLDQQQSVFFIKDKHTSSHIRSDCLMSDAAIATASAPSFFDPHLVSNQNYVDGGVIANNPTLCAIIMAIKSGVDISDIHVVSLGTGFKPPLKYDFIRKGLGYFATKLPTFLLSTQMNLVEAQIKMLIPESNYQRINFPLAHSIGLDAISDKNIDYLVSAAEKYIENNQKELDKLCDFLTKDHTENPKDGTPREEFNLDINSNTEFSPPKRLSQKELIGIILAILFLTFILSQHYLFYQEEQERMDFIRKPAAKGDYETAFANIEESIKEVDLFFPGESSFKNSWKEKRKAMGLMVIIQEAAKDGNFSFAMQQLKSLHTSIQDFKSYEIAASTFLAKEAASKKEYKIAIQALNTYKGSHFYKTRTLKQVITIAKENHDFQQLQEINEKIKLENTI